MRASRPSIARHFAGRDDNVVATYQAILEAARAVGPFEEDPKKTSIHLVRSTAFAGVAVQKTAVVLTLKSDREIVNARVRKSQRASSRRWYFEVRLAQPRDVNKQLRAWLARSYALAGSNRGLTPV